MAAGNSTKVRYFPAQRPGKCAMCGSAYSRLAMVAFFPAGQISHVKCITDPPKAQTHKPDAKVVSLLARKLEKLVKPGNTPRRFQIEFVEYVEAHDGRALCGDEMGTGKTVEVILWLALHPEVRPAVLVVPNSVKLNWPKEIAKWLPDGVGNSVHIISGATPSALPRAGVYVINYDIVRHWLSELRKVKPQLVVADECQNIKTPTAQRTIAVVGQTMGKDAGKGEWLTKDVPYGIATSGTPIENRPAELWPVLHWLRPDLWGNYWDFVYRHCNAHKKRVPFGARRSDGSRAMREILDISGASNIAELNKALTQHVMIRRLKADILSELPSKTRSIIPIEIVNRKEYDRAYAEFLLWLAETGADEKTLNKARSAEAIVKVNALKRLAAVGKLGNVVEWMREFLDTGKKLVVYGHHRSLCTSLVETFAAQKPAGLYGSIDARKVQAEIDRFQTTADCRMVIGSHKKAGQGATLHAASDMAIVELPWTPTALNQTEDRIHRIGQTQPCTYYYLLAANTIEEDICALLDSKRAVIGEVLDGKAGDGSANLLDALLRQLSKGR